jgi:hypothetical protein
MNRSAKDLRTFLELLDEMLKVQNKVELSEIFDLSAAREVEADCKSQSENPDRCELVSCS